MYLSPSPSLAQPPPFISLRSTLSSPFLQLPSKPRPSSSQLGFFQQTMNPFKYCAEFFFLNHHYLMFSPFTGGVALRCLQEGSWPSSLHYKRLHNPPRPAQQWQPWAGSPLRFPAPVLTASPSWNSPLFQAPRPALPVIEGWVLSPWPSLVPLELPSPGGGLLSLSSSPLTPFPPSHLP